MPKSSKKVVFAAESMKFGRVLKSRSLSFLSNNPNLFLSLIQLQKTSVSASEVNSVTQLLKSMKRDRLLKNRPLSFFLKNRSLFRLMIQLLSNKWSATEVGSLSSHAAPLLDPSSKSIEKGKRDTEEMLEKQVVSSKKQKTVDDTCDVMVAVEKNKFDTETLNKFVKIPVSISSDESESLDDSDSSLDDEDNDSRDESEFEDSSDEEEDAKNGSVAGDHATAKNSLDSSEDDSNSVEESDSDDESESEDSSDEDVKNVSVAAAPGNRTVESSDDDTAGSNYMYVSKLSPSTEEKHIFDFFKDVGKVVSVRLHRVDDECIGYGHVRFDTYETALKALERNGEELNGQAVKLALVDENRYLSVVQPPGKRHKYLFMSNLSPSIQKDDVLDFFKDAGKIESVRLDMKCGRFLGCGHVQFSTTEAAQKALKHNKEKLLGHVVQLVLATRDSVWYSCPPNSTIRRKKGPLGKFLGRGYGPTL